VNVTEKSFDFIIQVAYLVIIITFCTSCF